MEIFIVRISGIPLILVGKPLPVSKSWFLNNAYLVGLPPCQPRCSCMAFWDSVCSANLP